MKHLVVDDLRSFSDGRAATYLRTEPQYVKWLFDHSEGYKVGTLYLDYDLGWGGNTERFVNIMAGLDYKWDKPDITFKHVIVVTANIAAQDRLVSKARLFCDDVTVDFSGWNCGLTA